MKLDEATAVLRPRSAWEAVDLGCALARRHWGRIMRGWLTVALPLWTVIIILCREHPGWACFFIWLTKPVLTRQPVFFLSRALFGTPPGTRDFLRDWKTSLWKGLLPGLTIRRLSFQRSFRLPVIMLEGQQGRGYRQRVNVLSAHGGGNAASLALAGLVLQLVITIGLAESIGSFINESLADRALFRNHFNVDMPLWLEWMWTGFFAASVALIEPFYAAAGFALYINSRTHLEGWDIEVAFRRMSHRLVPPAVAAAMALLLGGFFTGSLHAAPANARDPKSVVHEILKGPDFELEKYKVAVEKDSKQPEKSPKGNFASRGSGAGFRWLGYVIIAALVCVVAYLLWQNRKALRRQTANGDTTPAGPRVVMGMDLAPESLPDDIPQAAWKEFQAGRPAEALRLLYRGSLAWFVDRASLPVHESDTEGDCLRHVQHLTDAERVSFFEFLTAVWINCAYAGEAPGSAPMKRLCESWPFSLRERRSASPPGAASALMLISFAVLLFQGCSGSKDDVVYEEKIAGYKGAAAVNPWLAATRLLDHMGIAAETIPALGTLPETETAVFVPATVIGSRGAAARMLSWAASGGHLIVGCSGTDRFHNDWQEFDLLKSETNVETGPAGAVLEELNVTISTESGLTTKTTFPDGETLNLESSQAVRMDLHGRPVDVLAGSEDSASLASFPWESGRVTLVASATPFRNRYIEKADNAAILYQLLDLESSKSLTIIFSTRANLWSMLLEYAWMPLAAVVLLVVLWLWRHLPVFGPALPADQSSVRHFGTQLDEAGAFLSDRAGRDALLASARRSVLQAAAQRGVHAEGANFAENLSTRTGVPIAAINDALHNHSDSGDFIASAATLQKLQQTLGVTL